jgi:ASC-1-like (ASCH) protein
MRHFLKLNYRFADPVYNGDKRFEIRSNDRAFQKGDEVKFTVVNDDGSEYKHFEKMLGMSNAHPLEDMVFEISYVISGWGLKNGFVVFGIKEKTE